MALGDFNKTSFENDVRNNIGDIVDALNTLAKLQQRATAEFAAGTFNGDDFYGDGTDPVKTRDKSNILGALDDMKALRDYAISHGQTAAPADPLRYAVFLF